MLLCCDGIILLIEWADSLTMSRKSLIHTFNAAELVKMTVLRYMVTA